MRPGAALWPVAVGVSWRQPHYREVMAGGPLDLDFLEVHAEDFLAPGGASRQLLVEASRRWPISLHGVGLGLGSAAGIDLEQLQRLRALADAVKPGLVSEHAGFTRVRQSRGIVHAHERLPLPFSAAGLSLLASQVDVAQQTLGRQILIENLGAYVCWEEDSLREPEFLNALAARTGCGLLVDLGTLLVNALNRGRDQETALRDCVAWLDDLEPSTVGQYHLSGHSRWEGMVVDGHGHCVDDTVWALYDHALMRLGARPTLIEWEHDTPTLARLCEEVARARRAQAALDRELIAPPPPRPSSRRAAVHGLKQGLPPATSRGHRPADAEQPAASLETGDALMLAQQSMVVSALLSEPGADVARLAPVGLRALDGLPGGLSQALRAYQSHVCRRAERALAAVYPRLRERMEHDRAGSFASLAWTCWRRHPPTQGDVGEWGEALIGLLASFQAEGVPPSWTSLARIEWELHRVERIADPRPDLDTLALLGRLPARAVRLVIAEHVVLHAGHPGLESVLDLAADCFGQGPRASLMVWRDGWGGRLMALDGVSTRWIHALRDGFDLERALLEVGPAFDFSAWLSAAVTHGWLARVETADLALTPWAGR